MRWLAILTGPDAVVTCLDAAVAAAARIGDARIEALHVVVDPERLVAASEEIALQRLRTAHDGDAAQREAAVRAAYDDWVAAHPDAAGSVRYREEVGGEEDGIAAAARDADLLVLVRARDIDAADALHGALRRTGRPLLLVPEGWPVARCFPERIAIAWDGSAAGRRVLQGAQPWLRAAAEITVLTAHEAVINPAPNGLRFVTRVVANDAILDETHRLGADLLVMARHVPGRLVEWLTGDTARHLLASADLPLLVAPE